MFNDNFNDIFSNLEHFSPELDDWDIFLPVHSSSSSSPNNDITQPLHFISQNVMRSNAVTHSLLNIVSSHTYQADVILLQEPWFSQIGIDVISSKDILGCPAHPDWMCILPPSLDSKPNVAIYVPKIRNSWQVQARHELYPHPSILTIDIITQHNTFLVINVYNPSDDSSLGPIIHSTFPPSSKVIISGDFNLHHPLWSMDSHDLKSVVAFHFFPSFFSFFLFSLIIIG